MPLTVQELQKRLYLAAKSRRTKFYSLYDKVYRDDVLLAAWKKVKDNKGTGGIDGVSIKEIEKRGVKEFLNGIKCSLIEKTYRPSKVKRVYIPKRSGGRRPLGIPTITDRVVQAAVKIILEPIFEVDFQDCSYGFRPKRNAKDACCQIRKWLNYRCTQVIDADLKSFFDTIPHDRLMKLIEKRVSDSNIIKLLWKWLKAGVLEEDRVIYTERGTPQGGVISPLLSNIFLNELDKEWKKRGYEDRNWYNAHLIRYADDLVILTNDNAPAVYLKLKEIVEALGISLNEEKTQWIDAREGFNFLGFRFQRRYSRRKRKQATYIYPPPSSVKDICQKITQLTSRKLPMKPKQFIKRINPVVLGWANYYTHTNASRAFDKVQWHLVTRVQNFLRYKKHRGRYGYWLYPASHLFQQLGLVKITGRIR